MLQAPSSRQLPPLAYVVLRDDVVRNGVVSVLDRAGWTSIEQPIGLHLLSSIADVMDGSRTSGPAHAQSPLRACRSELIGSQRKEVPK